MNRLLHQQSDDDDKGERAKRIEWIRGWLASLADRLCQVRITCGGWERILGDSSNAGATRLGIFFDPPYEIGADVYASDKAMDAVSSQVRDWCAENSSNPKYRIILCGRGDEHNSLGWAKYVWTANNGMANKRTGNEDRRHTEALWLSPHCIGGTAAAPRKPAKVMRPSQHSLFAEIEVSA